MINKTFENKITNNEIFRTMLHLTGVKLDKELLIMIFKLGGITATDSLIRGWMAEPGYGDRATNMPSEVLRGFFQGLFKYRDLKRVEKIQVFNFGIDFTKRE